MEQIIASLFLILIYGSCINYCYKVATKIGTNKVIAIVIGIVIPLGGALIYNHLSYRSKNGTAPKKGIFR
jgi:hypothetical protein